MIAVLNTSLMISRIAVSWFVASPTARNVMPESSMREPMILCSSGSMRCFLPLILLYYAVTIFKRFPFSLSL